MSNTCKIYPNVVFGNDCQLGELAVIGVPPKGCADGELATVLGDRAEVQSHAVIYAGTTFGNDVLIGHGTYIRHNVRIGNHVTVAPLGIWEGNIIVGDHVSVGPQTGIPEYTLIDAGVYIGPQVGLAAVLHPLGNKAKESAKGPHLAPGATVGGGACINPDLRIGPGSYIEPGAVVLRDVRPFAVVAGNPAKQVGDIFTLYPGLLDRVGQFVDLTSAGIAQTQASFASHPSLFPPR